MTTPSRWRAVCTQHREGQGFRSTRRGHRRMVRVLDARLVDYRLPADKRERLVSEIEVYARDWLHARMWAKIRRTRRPGGWPTPIAPTWPASTPRPHAQKCNRTGRDSAGQPALLRCGRAMKTSGQRGNVKMSPTRAQRHLGYQKALEDSAWTLEAHAGRRRAGPPDHPETPSRVGDGHQTIHRSQRLRAATMIARSTLLRRAIIPSTPRHSRRT